MASVKLLIEVDSKDLTELLTNTYVSQKTSSNILKSVIAGSRLEAQSEDNSGKELREKLDKAISDFQELRDSIAHSNKSYKTNDVLDILDKVLERFKDV